MHTDINEYLSLIFLLICPSQHRSRTMVGTESSPEILLLIRGRAQACNAIAYNGFNFIRYQTTLHLSISGTFFTKFFIFCTPAENAFTALNYVVHVLRLFLMDIFMQNKSLYCCVKNKMQRK